MKQFYHNHLKATMNPLREALQKSKGLINASWNEGRIQTLEDLGKVTDNWKDESGVTAQEYRQVCADILAVIEAALALPTEEAVKDARGVIKRLRAMGTAMKMTHPLVTAVTDDAEAIIERLLVLSTPATPEAAEQRTLQQCQDELIARGAVDIKLVWAPGEFTKEQREEDLCKFLNACLDGKSTPILCSLEPDSPQQPVAIDVGATLMAQNRKDYLFRNTPPCPACGAEQVQCTDWLTVPSRWKCRECKVKFDYEPLYAASPPAVSPSSTEQKDMPGVFGVVMPEGLHPTTVTLVVEFAEALANKLHAAQQKYGYTIGWQNNDWMDECRAKLLEHVEKGDPRDVAAYCAFLWWHKEKTYHGAALPLKGQVVVPVEPTI